MSDQHFQDGLEGAESLVQDVKDRLGAAKAAGEKLAAAAEEGARKAVDVDDDSDE